MQNFKDMDNNEGPFEETYESLEDFPDVFIYLIIKDKPACYIRKKITDFVRDPNPKWSWHEFTIDKAWGIVDE